MGRSQAKLTEIGHGWRGCGQRLVFQLAEVAVPREVFRQVPERIGGLSGVSMSEASSDYPSPGWRTPLGSSDVMMATQGKDACLKELDRSANVVKAAPAAGRSLTHDTKRWFCELDGLVSSIRE